MAKSLNFVVLAVCAFVFSSCASSHFRERQEKKEAMASQTGMYCGFVDGDATPDVDVELSIVMGDKCDTEKNFSLTNYKTGSEAFGVVYCCNAKKGRKAVKKEAPKEPAKEEAKDEVK